MAVRKTNLMCYLINRRQQGAMFVLCVIAWGWFVTTVDATPHDLDRCDIVQNHFKTTLQQGVKSLEFRDASADAEICDRQRSCCPRKTEERLASTSQRQLEQNVREAISKVANLLETKAKKFDDLFKEMLISSKREFHDMFKRTYGAIYIKNAFVFSDLFDELEGYYNKGKVQLSETMDNFFAILYQRMFTVINSQYQFDTRYLECVAENMKELRPFGDVPHKLSIQLKRSFVATRTYSKALTIGTEVTKKMLTIKLTSECGNALLQMQHCGSCIGISEPKACSDYCTDVTSACLAPFVALNSDWNTFVDAIDKVSERLLGSFNIEHVVAPIDIKISEAIMNFQENGPDVSQRVFTKCGKPILGRRRRRSSGTPQPNRKPKANQDSDIHFEGSNVKEIAYTEPLKFKEKKNKKDKKEPTMSQLEKIIKDTKGKVKDSLDFWNHLPYQMCNQEGMAEGPSEVNNCWNGTAVQPYNGKTSGLQSSRVSTVVNEQSYTLKLIVAKLHGAHQGQDVDWLDEDPDTNGSGSGSGDDRDDSDDEDRNENNNYDDDSDGPSGDRPYTYPMPEAPITNPPLNQPEFNITTYISDTSETTSSAKKALPITLARYLLPVVAIWLGAMFSELL